MSWSRRFLVHGVFWRQLLRLGVLNLPIWAEPFVIGNWAWIFLLWGPGRRGVMRNLSAILPGSSAFANFFRTFRVFWNFAWTITDTARFKETGVMPDWEFEGLEHFERLQAQPGGGIILTAHMGSADLGAHLFAAISRRQIVMVRAPETDPQTHAFEESLHERGGAETLKVDFSSRASDLALDLLDAVTRGELIAIQGDRVTAGIASVPATLFGKKTRIPSGPFALAMAARVPVYPTFIIRTGRRRYRLVVGTPFEVVRLRDRAASIDRAVAAWTDQMETTIRTAWFQWFTFEPFSEELTA